MKKLLILGCRRSGTTLLASLLGAHSDINMLDEVYDKSFEKLIGKKYQGMKMVIPRIAWNKRTWTLKRKIWKVLNNKINIIDRVSAYSVQDFINMDAKIIFISRDKEENIRSMIQWSKLTQKQAEKSYEKSQDIFVELCNYNNMEYVMLSQLTNKKHTEQILKMLCKFLEIDFEPKMIKASGLNNTYKNSVIEPKK